MTEGAEGWISAAICVLQWTTNVHPAINRYYICDIVYGYVFL
jgi:hypothetical protein